MAAGGAEPMEVGELPLSRQCTEEHPSTTGRCGAAHGSAKPLSTTPEKYWDGKRRRLTPESSAEAAALADGGGNSAGSSPPQLQPLAQGVEVILRTHLSSWGKKLVQLQPKVHMSEHLVESGLYLFKYLRQLQVDACHQGKFPAQYLSNEQLLIHDLIAMWWVALKHCSVRTAVPNRTLMCRATGADPELLSDRELGALIAIDWDVNAALRLGGLVT